MLCIAPPRQQLAASPTDAAVLPPERVPLETRHESHQPAASQHAAVGETECSGTGQEAFQGGFHMLISREREYLDCRLGGAEFPTSMLETR